MPNMRMSICDSIRKFGGQWRLRSLGIQRRFGADFTEHFKVLIHTEEPRFGEKNDFKEISNEFL